MQNLISMCCISAIMPDLQHEHAAMPMQRQVFFFIHSNLTGERHYTAQQIICVRAIGYHIPLYCNNFFYYYIISVVSLTSLILPTL